MVDFALICFLLAGPLGYTAWIPHLRTPNQLLHTCQYYPILAITWQTFRIVRDGWMLTLELMASRIGLQTSWMTVVFASQHSHYSRLATVTATTSSSLSSSLINVMKIITFIASVINVILGILITVLQSVEEHSIHTYVFILKVFMLVIMLLLFVVV